MQFWHSDDDGLIEFYHLNALLLASLIFSHRMVLINLFNPLDG